MKFPRTVSSFIFSFGRQARWLATVGVMLCAVARSSAQSPVSLTVAHSFAQEDADHQNSDGFGNLGYLVEGVDGNLYGTSPYGGANGNGTIFRVTPAGDFTVLHTFSAIDENDENADGTYPSPGLLPNADGSFSGTTRGGGANFEGTIFQITTAGEFTTLHSFSSQGTTDGNNCIAGLIRGDDGNAYGVAQQGGATGAGTIFKVTPAGVVTVVHSFDDTDGSIYPISLSKGNDGNFYGTTTDAVGDGSVFQCTPGGAFKTLLTFGYPGSAPGGVYPNAHLVQGADGAVYGTTYFGGTNGGGMIYRVTTAGVYSVVYNFPAYDGSTPGDGNSPREGVILGQDGNFYGTTTLGGPRNQGTIFRLTPAGVYSTVYRFSEVDGANPGCLLTQTSDGSLYGSTVQGGGNYGVIFKLAASTHPAFFSGEALLDGGVYFLALSDGNAFGYYSYLDDPRYIYHYDLGFEYVIDADDGNAGVYLYDFKSKTFFYTSPSFPFPYLYDFSLKSVLYYYPDPTVADRYNVGGVRTFYDFATGQKISK